MGAFLQQGVVGELLDAIPIFVGHGPVAHFQEYSQQPEQMMRVPCEEVCTLCCLL